MIGETFSAPEKHAPHPLFLAQKDSFQKLLYGVKLTVSHLAPLDSELIRKSYLEQRIL